MIEATEAGEIEDGNESPIEENNNEIVEYESSFGSELIDMDSDVDLIKEHEIYDILDAELEISEGTSSLNTIDNINSDSLLSSITNLST